MRLAWGMAARAAILLTIASCGGSTASKSGDVSAPDNPDGSAISGSDAGAGSAGTDASSAAPPPRTDAGTGNGSMVNCGPSSPAPSTIAGTWDVQGSRMNNKPLTATLVIDDSHFTFAVTNGSSLTFSSAANAISLVWRANPLDAPVNIVATHASAPLSQGIVPLLVGGMWTFTGSEPNSPTHCQADIIATTPAPTLGANCIGTSGFPEPFPYSLDGSVTGTRTQVLPSLFGDLGGTWHLADQSTGTCDATFQGNTVDVTCGNAGVFTGEATLTFCDGVASGSTSAGIEFSALRQ